MRRAAALAGLLLVAVAALFSLGPSALLQSGRTAEAAAATWDNHAQRQNAQAMMLAEDPERAARFARQALTAMPYDQFALAVASIDASADRRLAALNLASGLGWRDAATNLALIETAIANGDPVTAAQRLDALGRTQPELDLAPFADRLLAQPGGIEALADRAARRSNSPWWQGFFRSAPADETSAERRIAMLALLDREDGMWLRTAARDAGIGFRQSGLDAKAFAVWRRTIADEGLIDGPVYDPEFSQFGRYPDALGGEWRSPREAPALVEKLPGGLRIESRSGEGGIVLQQQIALPNGRWQLTATGLGGSGYRWQIACAGQPRLQLEPGQGQRRAIGQWRMAAPGDCNLASLSLVHVSGRSTDVIELQRVAIEPVQ